MSSEDERAFRQRLQRIETLVEQLELVADPATRAAARELMQALLDLHRAGLARLLEIAGPACVGDDLVSSVLLLHGLHPVALQTRVVQALERVRPLLRGHGVEVELVDVAGGTIRLRLQGGSAPGVLHAIEEAIVEAAPDATTLEIETPTSGRVPLPLVN